MGFGGYQGGLFFDWSGSYAIAFANAAAAGLINLIIVGSLYYYVRQKNNLLDQTTAA